MIRTAPLADATGYAPPVGRYTFTILSVDGQTPNGDMDGDGLTNLEEAARGSAIDDADTDGDGVADATDDCPLVADPAQTDGDGDGVGQACDSCPLVSDPAQVDSDVDGTGDLCDLDDGLLWFGALTRSAQSWQASRARAALTFISSSTTESGTRSAAAGVTATAVQG